MIEQNIHTNPLFTIHVWTIIILLIITQRQRVDDQPRMDRHYHRRQSMPVPTVNRQPQCVRFRHFPAMMQRMSSSRTVMELLVVVARVVAERISSNHENFRIKTSITSRSVSPETSRTSDDDGACSKTRSDGADDSDETMTVGWNLSAGIIPASPSIIIDCGEL